MEKLVNNQYTNVASTFMLYVNKIPFGGSIQYKPTTRRLTTKFNLEFTH